MSKHPVVMYKWPKMPTTHTEKIFSVSTTRLHESFEGLNNFLAQSAGE